MTSHRYSRRPAEVEAIRHDEHNTAEVAAFACGRVDQRDGHTVVRLPKTTIPVRVGDWAVRDVLPDGLGDARCMLDHIMEWGYEPTGEPRRHRHREQP